MSNHHGLWLFGVNMKMQCPRLVCMVMHWKNVYDILFTANPRLLLNNWQVFLLNTRHPTIPLTLNFPIAKEFWWILQDLFAAKSLRRSCACKSSASGQWLSLPSRSTPWSFRTSCSSSSASSQCICTIRSKACHSKQRCERKQNPNKDPLHEKNFGTCRPAFRQTSNNEKQTWQISRNDKHE